MQMILNLIRQLLGGSNQAKELFDMLQAHIQKNGGKLNLPDGLIPPAAMAALENAIGSNGMLSKLPVEVMKPEIVEKLMKFLQQEK